MLNIQHKIIFYNSDIQKVQIELQRNIQIVYVDLQNSTQNKCNDYNRKLVLLDHNHYNQHKLFCKIYKWPFQLEDWIYWDIARMT